MRLSGSSLYPGSIGVRVRCGANSVPSLFHRSDTDIPGRGLLLRVSAAKRGLRAGHSLRSTEESKMAGAISMDRDGARAGPTCLSLHSAILADLSYAIDPNLFAFCQRCWSAA